jgi:AraC family transcriptional regulator, arabinose operon regulatory protein
MLSVFCYSSDDLAADMDKTHGAKTSFEIRGHRHRAVHLPRPWVALPAAECRAAHSHPLLRGLFPSHVGYFPKAREHRVKRPGIDSTIVNYCVAGEGWCELAGRRFVVRRGDVMVVPAGMAHGYGSDAVRPWSVYWFHAMGEHVPALLAELQATEDRPVVHVGHRSELVALLSELHMLLEHDCSRPRLLYAAGVLNHIWAVMIDGHRDARQRGDGTALRVRRTLEYLQRHFARRLRVEALAAMAGLSASQYTERFRMLTGDSPKSYLMRLRIRRAAQLLEQSQDTIANIARQVGYDDALYFSRAFRRVHDTCPSAYRDAHGHRF